MTRCTSTEKHISTHPTVPVCTVQYCTWPQASPILEHLREMMGCDECVCVRGPMPESAGWGGGGCGREGGGYSLSCVLDLAAETSPTQGALILDFVTL